MFVEVNKEHKGTRGSSFMLQVARNPPKQIKIGQIKDCQIRTMIS